MHDSRDEAVAEPSAAAASPPDANVLEIRASAADAILGSASFQKAEAATARRLPPLFERLLTYGPRAALAACLFGFAGVAGAYFSGGRLPFYAMKPQPAWTDGSQPSVERAEILRSVQKMADEIRALKARVEAMHATQSLSAKDATALEGLKARLDAVKTETGAEIAELAGKVERMQREFTQVSERFDRVDHRVAAPLATAAPAAASASGAAVAHKQTKNRRGDAFDPSQNPGAPGAPRPLGSLAPAAKVPVQSF